MVENVSDLHVVGGQAFVTHAGSLARADITSGEITIIGHQTSQTYCLDSATTPSVRLPSLMVDDGTFLYFVDACSSKYVLRRASLTTGAISTMATLDRGATGLTVGPGGVLYHADADGLHTVDVNTGIRTAVESWNTTGAIYALTADATHLWLTVNRDNRRRIVRYDPATGRSIEMPLPEKTYTYTHLTSAGDYLYAASGNEVVQITKSTGTTTPVAGSGSSGQINGT
ncbi:hypothetical protein, partial [Cellulosimicrobium cellulans]|uniref:hypothetical protein n=1 Tax=Cellulosimicrobium cellulans TaxID=1710 RepID=UPI001C9E8451